MVSILPLNRFFDTNHHRYVDVQQWKHLFLICRSISFFNQIIFIIVVVVVNIIQHIQMRCSSISSLDLFLLNVCFEKSNNYDIFLSTIFISCGRNRNQNAKKREKRNIDKYLIWFCNAHTVLFLSSTFVLLLLFFSSSSRFIDSNLVISNKINIKLLSTHFSSR